MKLREGWSSHTAMLIKVLQHSEGPVLEIGGGLFSTPLLHWMCKEMDRKLITYENDRKYYGFIKDFNRGDHQTILVEDWNKIDIESTHWGMVFIDHSPSIRRIKEAKRVANNADFIICHDTQPGEDKFYKYHWLWDKFKYIYHYEKASPRTSVLSNFKDLTFLYDTFGKL